MMPLSLGNSQFEKIPLSQERQAATIEKQIDEIELAIDQAKRDNGGVIPLSRWKNRGKHCRCGLTS